MIHNYSLHSVTNTNKLKPRPMTAISVFQNGNIPSNKRLKDYSKSSRNIKTIRYFKAEQPDEKQNQQTLLRLFDAKCIDSRTSYSSQKALMFLNRFTTNRRRLKLTGMELGYNSMKIVCQILKLNDCFHVDLEKNKLGDASILELANFLSQTSSIVYLHLGSNSIKQIGSQHLFESLMYNSSLTHLELGSKNGYNKNSVKSGTKALCQALKINKTLYYLGLSYTQIGFVTMNNLYEGLKHNTSLMDLDLSSNDLGESCMDNIIKMLRHHDLLTLNLSHNQFGNEATKDLFQFFNAYNRNLKLRQLKYDNNNINHKAGYYIFQTLRSNVSIQKLSLCQNTFSYQIMSVTCCLQQNKILEELFLQNSKSKGLERSKKLKLLSLNGNKLAQDQGCSLFKFLQSNISLNRLQLHKCELGDQAVISLSKSLTNNRTLQYLILTDNYINDIGGRQILSAIEKNAYIKQISLDSNLLGYKIFNSINSHLKHNRSRQLQSKYPMKKQQLKILENNIRDEQITMTVNTSQLVDRQVMLVEQIRILQQKVKYKIECSKKQQKTMKQQLKTLQQQYRKLQKVVFSKKQIDDISQQIIDLKQKILIEKDTLVQLQRRCGIGGQQKINCVKPKRILKNTKAK